MTAKDQLKLLAAGFIIIRKRDFVRANKPVRFEIFQKTPERGEWHSKDWNFESNYKRQKAIDELLKNQNVVED